MSNKPDKGETVPYPRPPRDMDSLMLAGCTGFVLVSFLTLALSIWPFFVWSNEYQAAWLLKCSLCGAFPSAALGAIAIRRFGLPTAAGYVAGALATAVFLYVRLTEIFLGAQAKRIPEPDYPSAFTYLLPLAWVLLSVLVAVLLLRPEEIEPKQP